MQKNDKTITITTEEGKEMVCNILFTFDSERFNNSYVVFQAQGEEFASAAIYNPANDGTGSLEKIESEEEWDLVAEVFDQYFSENSHQCNGNCDGCESCDEECGDDEGCNCNE